MVIKRGRKHRNFCRVVRDEEAEGKRQKMATLTTVIIHNTYKIGVAGLRLHRFSDILHPT